MPENHDTDFNWPDFVEKVNSELIAAYGNFVHRVLTLGGRLPTGNAGPFEQFDNPSITDDYRSKLEVLHSQITDSLERHRYKEALRYVMNAAQLGNQMLQSATPGHISKKNEDSEYGSEVLCIGIPFFWMACSTIFGNHHAAIFAFQFISTVKSLGQNGAVSSVDWHSAIDWNVDMTWSGNLNTPFQETRSRRDFSI